jgi:prepilin-type N-terminal cleavage/methylation domain-containing protein
MMNRSRRHPRAGFTFIEIMFVVVILTTLAALSFPRMKGTFFKARVNKAARDVVGTLRMARNTAVVREKPCEVRLDAENDLYMLVLLDEFFQEIEQPRKRTYRKKKSTHAVNMEILRPRRLPKDVHFDTIYSSTDLTEDDLSRIIYYPDGSATPTTISIRDESNLGLSVEVYRTTGMAHIEPGIKDVESEKKKGNKRRGKNRW